MIFWRDWEGRGGPARRAYGIDLCRDWEGWGMVGLGVLVWDDIGVGGGGHGVEGILWFLLGGKVEDQLVLVFSVSIDL